LAAANKNRTQRSIDGLSHVDCIDLVVREGTLVTRVDEIATSSRRCLTAHHLDPEIEAAPHTITEKELRDSSEPLRKVMLHAQEELDRLYAIVGPQQCVVLSCDRDGVAIYHRGDESQAHAYKDCGIWGSPNQQRPGREAAVPLALRELPNGARTQKLLGLCL
jgi:transcriptional regulator of acetoin/glycerol metabolism